MIRLSFSERAVRNRARHTSWRKARDDLAMPVAVVTVILTGMGASLGAVRLLSPLPQVNLVPLATFCIACWFATFALLNAKQEGLFRRLAPRLALYSAYTFVGSLVLLLLLGVLSPWS